ncbi:hypothetical protein SAMN05443248_3800 [Bradyrhizobium erythrophlei]|jgi:hypothetical protein|uniref:Uncharacterized protein n=1 Tax=Bradyrhizobium erythrophlei TaxID=1437360 RepID=A0A1M5QGD7_9BRAD|nr:hypothetical protein SAMN05443248_3800 [Bradyrhizobium erythrophlei]
MSSLKAFLPQLADVIGSTPAALYERQRALVRQGVLQPLVGRGPGSGVELSADAIAALLISVGAASSLSEVDSRIIKYCEAQSAIGKCLFTNQKKLRGALAVILTDLHLLGRTGDIVVHHEYPLATIDYRREDGEIELSLFGTTKPLPQSRSKMCSLIRSQLLSEISNLLRETNSEGTS